MNALKAAAKILLGLVELALFFAVCYVFYNWPVFVQWLIS